jgi:predicted phosphodiesterase
MTCATITRLALSVFVSAAALASPGETPSTPWLGVHVPMSTGPKAEQLTEAVASLARVGINTLVTEVNYGKWEASADGTAPAIESIPRDIILCDWHYEPRASYESIAMFLEKGFRVWPASWRKPDAAKALIDYSRTLENPRMMGHLNTTWGAVEIGALVDFEPLKYATEAFRTIRFGVCADVHKDVMPDADARLRTFVDRMNREPVDFIVQLGDFCRPIDMNRDFLGIWNRFKGPRYHVLGNHDTDGGFTRDQTLRFWGMPSKYYSFDIGAYHFVVLDGNDKKEGAASGYARYMGREQAAWLQRDLSETRSPTVIFSHQSIENVGGLENGAEIRGILERANAEAGFRKVFACFSGHHHTDYDAVINGIHYIQINSMSYEWLGSKYKHARFSKEIEEAYPWVSHTAPYRDSLYAIVTLQPDQTIRILGVESEWIAPSPQELGVPENPGHAKSVPRISSRILKAP